MRASRADANPELTGHRSVTRGGSAALLDFAVTQISGERPLARTLPRVLERIVAAFGLRAAIAFRPGADPPATLLAAHPADAGEPGLLARLGWLPGLPDSTGPAPVRPPGPLGGRGL